MKIKCEFDSFEEFIDFANGGGEKQIIQMVIAQQPTEKKAEKKEAPKADPHEPQWVPGGGFDETAASTPAKVPEKDAEAPKQEAEPVQKAEAPAQISEPVKEDAPAEANSQPKVDESYRVQVRKTLAALNKKTGKNTASELIKGFGVEKLTGVALEDLPALMTKAEEALNA